MREAVVYALELLRVKVIFVEEAQHLMYVDTPHKPTAPLDWLKALTNRTNVLHVIYNQKSSPLTPSFRRCLRAAAQV